jgi:glycosyltransferase involved in cell wall biosynthesis
VSQDVADHLAEVEPHARYRLAHDHLNAAPLMERITAHKQHGTRLLPFPAEQPVVGWIGRITRYKQPHLFIRAVPRVLQAFPEARFAVVGAAQPGERDYEASLPELASQLGVTRQTAFLGLRPDALEILTELDVYCLTSGREPFPRTVLEAQLADCPVVAAGTGGCPEMMEHETSGLLFDPSDAQAAEQLAAHIIGLLQNPDRGTALAAAAKQRLLESWASDLPIRKLEAHLSGLACRSTSVAP